MLEHLERFTDPHANPSADRDGNAEPRKLRSTRWVVLALALLLIIFMLPSPWRSSQGESGPSSHAHSPSATDSDETASAEPAPLQSASFGGDADRPGAVIAAATVGPGHAGTPAAIESGSFIPSHGVLLASSALDPAELLAAGSGNVRFHAAGAVAPTTRAGMSTAASTGMPSPLQLAAGLGTGFPTPLASASGADGTGRATGPAGTGSQDSAPTELVDARSPAATPSDNSGPANPRAEQSPARNAVPDGTSTPRANDWPFALPEHRFLDDLLLSDAPSGDPDLNGPGLVEPRNPPVAANEQLVTAAAVPIPGTGLLMLLAGVLLLCVRRSCVSPRS